MMLGQEYPERAATARHKRCRRRLQRGKKEVLVFTQLNSTIMGNSAEHFQ